MKLEADLKKLPEPFTISLEADSRCQLKCPACPTAKIQAAFADNKSRLTLANFNKIVNENPRIRSIELSNAGEIFLNREMGDIIESAFRQGVNLTAVNGTNFNTLSEEVLEALVFYGFRYLNISIDGATQEVYEQYRVGGDLNRVINNIRTINQYKRKYGTNFPYLNWQFIVFGHNEHQISNARQMAKELSMSFSLKISDDPEGISPIRNKALVREQTGFADRAEFLKKTGRHFVRGMCYMLWNQPQIHWDGSIHGCYRNPGRPFKGNVFQQPLIEALRSEELEYTRAMLMGKVPDDSVIPCHDCELYQVLQESGNWLTEQEIWSNRLSLG
jgi:MoaA/NifB/PqqE/SkfB family radical SAM enzyme